MTDQALANITGVVSTCLPSIIGLVQSLFKQQNPTEPVPTSADILAVFGSTCLSSLAKDSTWLEQHPKG